ncbi:MAG: phosphate ABC transporter substrate-binding protein, partial [Chlorobi bacterium]|nr:phosphate ABC transporter substrate-binding protein [Chlorobiota bacterium]
MKKIKTLKKFFGSNEFGLIDFPKKISNVQISRILYGDEMGCSY